MREARGRAQAECIGQAYGECGRGDLGFGEARAAACRAIPGPYGDLAGWGSHLEPQTMFWGMFGDIIGHGSPTECAERRWDIVIEPNDVPVDVYGDADDETWCCHVAGGEFGPRRGEPQCPLKEDIVLRGAGEGAKGSPGIGG